MAGGLEKTLIRAKKLRLETVQIFSGNPRAFFSKPLEAEAAAAFSQGLRAAGIAPLVVHAPYPMNLASPDDETWNRSVEMLLNEMERCRMLGAGYLVFHPGNHLGAGSEAGVERVAEAMKRGLDRGAEGVVLAVENTAGSGTALGGRLEEQARILELAGGGRRTAFWLDTAHAFGAGYDVGRPEGVDAWLGEAERIIGLERLAGFHINDAKVGLASFKDRHEHLGRGKIGGRGLSRVLAHPKLWGLPGVLETPRVTMAEEKRNLAAARRFRTLGLKAVKGER